jgi:hypothetical protein
MRDPHRMSRFELAAVVAAIIDALYCEADAPYDPDKQWSPDTLLSVQDILVGSDLAPSDPASLPSASSSAAMTAALTMGDYGKPYATVTIGETVVTVHESTVTPGAVNLEVDLASDPLIVHVNDSEVYRSEPWTLSRVL